MKKEKEKKRERKKTTKEKQQVNTSQHLIATCQSIQTRDALTRQNVDSRQMFI